MIDFANLTDEQETIIKQACQEQIDSLQRILDNPYMVQSGLILSGHGDISEEQIEEVLEEQIEKWRDIQEDPQSVFKLDQINIKMIQFVISEFFDKCDGNPTINGIWAKFMAHKDFKKQFPTSN